MAGKKKKAGSKGKAEGEARDGPAGGSSPELPSGSVSVLSDREKDWLPAEPEAPYKRHDEPGFGEAREGDAPSGADGKALLGKRVVDTEGLELGYVDEVSADELTVGEGPFSEWLRIKKNFIGDVGDEVRLLEPLQELLQDVEVFDAKGRSIGWVSDVIATGDVVDGLIVKGPRGTLFVLLEDICSIGGTLTLDITYAELARQAANRRRSR